MSKTVSKVFIIIGWILNLITAISAAVEFGALSIIFFVVWLIGIVLGISALASSDKSVGLGIGLIFFVSPLAGIFYLCWDGIRD